MTVLQTTEATPTTTVPQASQRGDAALQGILERTSDLPHGGEWWVVDLDFQEQWRQLPEWMIKNGVWLMPNRVTVCPPWYAWVPAKGNER